MCISGDVSGLEVGVDGGSSSGAKSFSFSMIESQELRTSWNGGWRELLYMPFVRSRWKMVLGMCVMAHVVQVRASWREVVYSSSIYLV